VTHIQQADRPDRLSIMCSETDGIRVVALHGEIDHDVRDALSEALLPRDGAAPLRIVMDLSGVTFMDSSGINVLVAAHRTAGDTEGWLRISGAQEPVLRVIELVGLDALIPCLPTIEHALTV
jgi:anti-anti-sigma factor